jgi:uncharacterized repeat protein (TIGR03806 family)
MILKLSAAIVPFTLLAGCGPDAPVTGPTEPASIPYETLSEYAFFTGALAQLDPAPRVLPYSVNAALWSDGAQKNRFIVLPEGEQATFDEGENWGLPPGTIVIKTFSFPEDQRQPEGARRVIETRLLIRDDTTTEGWTAHTYLWNDAQTEATRLVAGRQVSIDFTDQDGFPQTQTYLVPNTNQCSNCHSRDDVIHALGITTPQMNRSVTIEGVTRNQLEWLAEKGVFDAPLPPPQDLAALPDPLGNAPLVDRARAYLHANCSHCHRPGGGGGSSGLVLLESEQTPTKYGVCKGSVAAGSGTGSHLFDIVPGHPEESIMTFRMSSTDPEIKMPEVPNLLPDPQGIDLVTQWIAAMQPQGCP